MRNGDACSIADGGFACNGRAQILKRFNLISRGTARSTATAAVRSFRWVDPPEEGWASGQAE